MSLARQELENDAKRILSLYKNGTSTHEEACAEILPLFVPRITGILVKRWRVRIGAQVEDLAHDVLLRVVKYLPSHDPSRQFVPWIDQITRNVAIESWRRNRKHIDKHVNVDDLLDSVELPVDSEAGVERRAEIRWLLQRLTKTERTLLLQKHLYGLRNAQIARLWGLSLKQVKSRLENLKKSCDRLTCPCRETSAECLGRGEKNSDVRARTTPAIATAALRDPVCVLSGKAISNE